MTARATYAKAFGRDTFAGVRVRAVSFGPGAVDDNLTVPPGTEGTVIHVDDAGTLHVSWDNGALLGLLPRCDKWEVVSV